MNILEKIEQLRNEGKSPNEIETLLLTEKLGEIRIDNHGYQYIENFALSWLIVEAHRPGFVKWMKAHPYKFVVHHKDGNKLNNTYLNLQVMSWGDHLKLHRNDPKFAEVERVRNEKHSDWYKDPDNIGDIEAMCKKVSNWWKDSDNAEVIENRDKAILNSIKAYFADPANAKDIETRNKAISKTKRKNWIDLKTFKKPFTVKEYAEASKVSVDTAYCRLSILLSERQIICEKMLFGGKWCNVYRKRK